MSELYRFKFRTDFFEIELESTDADFIDRKILQLIEFSTRPFEDRPKLLTPYSDSSFQRQAAEESAEETQGEEQTLATGPAEKKEEAEKPKTSRRKSSVAGRKPKVASPKKKAKASSTKKKAPEASGSAKEAVNDKINPSFIAEQVRSIEKYDAVKKKILDKANQLNRILLSFYFAELVHGKKGLSTGDVEAISLALGTGIKSTNVSSQLKKHSDLFHSRGERKRGSVVYYKLNKKGKEQFEALINKL